MGDKWTVHIVGPDDVIPKADELEALRHANAVNVEIERARRRYANDPNYPFAIALAKKQTDQPITARTQTLEVECCKDCGLPYFTQTSVEHVCEK